jgi:RNA polymerase sigma-70 factor (ECF subfamily)
MPEGLRAASEFFGRHLDEFPTRADGFVDKSWRVRRYHRHMDWLADLYDAHAGGLYAFLLNLTRSRAESEDILHDLFLKVARDEKRFRCLAQPKSYLFAMAHRAVIDAVRRAETRQRRHEEADPAEFFVPNPDQAFFQAEVAAALAALPIEQRAAVHLKLWEDLTFEQMAEVLGIPANTAASRYRYGLDKLRERLRSTYKELRDGT